MLHLQQVPFDVQSLCMLPASSVRWPIRHFQRCHPERPYGRGLNVEQCSPCYLVFKNNADCCHQTQPYSLLGLLCIEHKEYSGAEDDVSSMTDGAAS